eukprot:Skav220456  [mRNA]  locus=scaffold254:272846:275461:- [translate_table: standard]
MLVGCTVVLKPSEAGVPAGVYNMVMGDGPNCGEVIAAHEDVDLAPSSDADAGGIFRSPLPMAQVRTELGGKSAALLLEDRA